MHRLYIRLFSALFYLLLMSPLLTAQILPQTGQEPDSIGIIFDDSLDVSRPSEIAPDTRRVDRHKLFTHQEHETDVKHDISQRHIWEPTEREKGFVYQLGQTGKVQEIFQYGFSNRLMDRALWWNPLFGRYNVYLVDAEKQVPFYHTKTPYVNVDFLQGARDLQLVEVGVSQNIRYNWNVAAGQIRRQATGAYTDNVTDHRTIYVSSNYHDFSKRYNAFVSAVYNDHNDQFNGGTYRPASQSFEESFNKAGGRVNLSNARSKRIQKAIYGDQYLHIFGHETDSVERKNKLSIRNAATWEYAYQRFHDTDIDTFTIAQNIIPVYPLLADTLDVFMEAETYRGMILGEASYSFTSDLFYFNLNGGIKYQLLNMRHDTLNITQNTIQQNIRGEITFPSISLRNELVYRQDISNLTFAPATYLNIKSSLPFPLRQSRYKEVWWQVPTDSMKLVRKEARRAERDARRNAKEEVLKEKRNQVKAAPKPVSDKKGKMQQGQPVEQVVDSTANPKGKKLKMQVPPPTDSLKVEVEEKPDKLNKKKKLKKVVEADSLTVDSIEEMPLPPDSLATSGDEYFPLYFSGGYLLHSQNPSLFQRFFNGADGYTFKSRILNNQQVNHLHVGATLERRTPIFRGDTLRSDMFSAKVFLSRRSRQIYYSPEMEVLQAQPGQSITWLGISSGLRYRFWRKFYLHNDVSWQLATPSATADSSLLAYTKNIPAIYGRAGVYFESHKLSYADGIKGGLDLRYNSGFLGQTVEPVSGEFYPTDYQVQGYVAADLYVNMQIKRTLIMLKLTHANEGVLIPGYYSVPFYPGLERTFTLGVVWSFYD